MAAAPADQTNLYDELSAFIQHYKRALALAHSALRHPDPPVPLSALADLAAALDPLAARKQPLDPNIFQRFMCRLLEIAGGYPMKYQQSEGEAFSGLLGSLKELQKLTREEDRSIGKVQRVFQNALLRFCLAFTDPHLQNGPLALIHQRTAQRLEMQRQSESKSPQKQRESPVKSKMPTVSQTLADIQKRYELMKGLEVDYPSFKSSFFDARSTPEQLYRSYYERNHIVSKAIALYRDDFHLFRVRRENRQVRRERRGKANQQSSWAALPKKQNKEAKIKERPNLTCDEKQLKDRLNQIAEEPSAEADSPKAAYKLKNVFITLSRKAVTRTHKPQPRIKPLPLPHSLSDPNTSLQRPLFALPEEKPSLARIKTDYENVSAQWEKVQLRGKCVEVGSLVGRRQQNSKCRLVLIHGRPPQRNTVKLGERRVGELKMA